MEDALIAMIHVKHAHLHIVGVAHLVMMDITFQMMVIIIDIVKNVQLLIVQNVKFHQQLNNKFA